MRPLSKQHHWCRAGFALAVMLTVAGCAEGPAPGAEASLLRNPTVPLGGTSRFTAKGFAGEWQTIACIGQCANEVRYYADADGRYMRQSDEAHQAYQLLAPGVLRDSERDQTLVVMWVDEGFRTAAVGDADGRWAAILDRGAGAADRTRAATEILDFNGWDTGKLRKMKR